MKFLLELLVLITAFAIVQCNPYCDLFCDYGENVTYPHTACARGENKCGPDPRCGSEFKVVKLTDEQRQMVLNMHNALRCRVGLGKETRGRQPPAKNMRVMTYDRELEFIAQCWANACNGAALIHDDCRRTRKFEHVGQNLGFVNSSADNINFTVAMQQLTRYWYEEVTIFNNEWVLDTRDRGHDIKVGHYTQMMWADSYRLGCAASHYTVRLPDGTKSYEFLFVCNYGPGGNYIGQPVYKPGEPGTGCPEKLKHHNKCGMCGSFVNATKQDNFKPFFKL